MCRASRSIVLQVTQDSQFLHRNGFCHGGQSSFPFCDGRCNDKLKTHQVFDYRLSNILLRLKDLDHLTESELATVFGEPKKEPVLTVSGDPPGPSAPIYVVQPVLWKSSALHLSPTKHVSLTSANRTPHPAHLEAYEFLPRTQCVKCLGLI
jgi:hypothetical protein